MTQLVDASGQYREKRPASVADFSLNWVDLLAGDTIDTSEWEVPSGITQEVSPAASNTDTTTTIWVSGGTAGTEYQLVNTITTDGGRTFTRALRIKVVPVVVTQPEFSFDELSALRSAYASGVTRVRYGVGSDQKEVEYPSGDELLKRIRQLEGDLSGTVSNKRFTLSSYRR